MEEENNKCPIHWGNVISGMLMVVTFPILLMITVPLLFIMLPIWLLERLGEWGESL